MRLNFVVVGCFVGFYIDVLVLSDFLYVFSEFRLEIICCDAVDFINSTFWIILSMLSSNSARRLYAVVGV